MSLESSLNALADMDWGWWPLLRLRPQRHERMTTGRVALISVAFSTLLTIAVFSAIALRSGITPDFWARFTLVALASPPTFFVIYRLTFAVAWNVRAERLHREEQASTTSAE